MTKERLRAVHTSGFRRQAAFRVLLLSLGFLAGLLLAEFALALVAPQETLSPRYMFNKEYGVRPFPSVTMVHSKRGSFHFEYTTNRRGHRGRDVPISNRYEVQNIVILGDSRSFGMGVDDGEEYATLLEQRFADSHQVVNLATPSWGLTQQIRCYYELGQLYKPTIVILQTNANDVEDCQINQVTILRDKRFVFQDSPNSANWLKHFLSSLWIQKSNLYNLVRDDLYQWLTRRSVRLPENAEDAKFTADDSQLFYNELLKAFVEDLSQSGVELVLFSHEIDFRYSPLVKRHILELDASGLLKYCPLDPWLEGQQNYDAPDGHILGRVGHRIAADGLASFLQKEFPDTITSNAR